MATVISETHESGTNGAAITVAGSAYTTVGTGVVYTSTDAIHGSLSAQVSGTTVATVARVEGQTAGDDTWTMAYFLPMASTTGLAGLYSMFRGRISGTTAWDVVINSTGQLILRNELAASVGTSAGFVANGTDTIRIAVNTNDTTNAITARLYYGSNLEGSTPTETLSGPYAPGGVVDRLDIGMGTNQTDTTTRVVWDSLVIDNAVEPTAIGTPGGGGGTVTTYAFAPTLTPIDGTAV